MKKLLLTSMLFSGAAVAGGGACDISNAINAWDNVREDVATQMDVTAPGLEGTACKLTVNSTAANADRARVQDQTPSCEPSFRARFVFNADEVTAAGSLGNGAMERRDRNKLFNAQCITAQNGGSGGGGVDCNGIGVIQLRLQGDDVIAGEPDHPGENILFSFVSDENQFDFRKRFKMVLQPGMNVVEMEWQRASGPGVSDGVFRGWYNNTALNSPDTEFTDLNNYNYCIDQVNLGLIKATQRWADAYEGLNIQIDEYEPRRQTPIGLN